VEPDGIAPPPRGPARYGAGLAVLVVGTGDEPFRGSVVTPRVAGSPVPVVLVDSGAGGAPRTRGADGGVTAVSLGEDVGRGAAVNRAVAALPNDIGLVALAPPGLEWADGALDALCAAAARYPRAGVMSPAVREPSGAPVPSVHSVPRPGGGVLAVLRRRPWPPVTATPSVEGPVGWSSAPALLLRRAALDSVDGFDPRYRGRLDDLDLAERLACAGWLTVHVPAAAVCRPVTADRPDADAARRYLADRSPPPVRALLRARSC
jgi:N-acetylglucosaminyl-diphospho-decaprenol L-rhamnosyltransferase